jgi:two-component system, LytTR family, response regulator
LKLLHNSNSLIIKKKEIINIIPFSDILYFESFSSNVIIKTKDSEIKIKYSLKLILSLLPSHFFRCHKSYIINLYYINKLEFIKGTKIYKITLTNKDFIFTTSNKIKSIMNNLSFI